MCVCVCVWVGSVCLFVVCANVYVLYCWDARQRLTLANVAVCVHLVVSLLLKVNVELCFRCTYQV